MMVMGPSLYAPNRAYGAYIFYHQAPVGLLLDNVCVVVKK